MKSIRLIAGLLSVLLTLLLLAACRKDKPSDPPGTDSSDTTASDTSPSDSTSVDISGSGGASSDDGQGSSAGDDVIPDEEPETIPPTTLSAGELKALLNAALDQETGDAAVTVTTASNGEVFSTETYIRLGRNFYAEVQAMSGTERITVVGDQAYYFTSAPAGPRAAEGRYVMSVTAEERGKLMERFFEGSTPSPLHDAQLTEALLNSAVSGVRHADGTVELTCAGLDDGFTERLFGAPVEEGDLSFAFKLDRDVRVTYVGCTLRLPAEITDGDALTVSSETEVNYAPAAIAAPKDAVSYTLTTYDDVFGIPIPEADPHDATAAGVPLDKDHYTFIGENPIHDPKGQYTFVLNYSHNYEGKTFILYGTVTENSGGRPALTVGKDLEIAVDFKSLSAPTAGSYVRVTAVYTKTTDGGDDASGNSYTMSVTACEVLGQAQGPNGGRLMYVTSSALNVRSSTDTATSSNILGTLGMGDLIEVFEQDDSGWYRVVYKGRIGYVSGKYLSETRP